MHSHKNFEVNFMVNARGKRFVGGNISDYGEGDLVLLGPDLPHCWIIDNKEEKPTALTIHFHEEFYDSGFFNAPELNSIQNLLDKSKYGIVFKNYTPAMLEKMLRELMDLTGFNAMVQVLKILHYFTQINDIQILSEPGFIWMENSDYEDRLKKIYEYIFLNFQKEITLKDVADQINLTEGALCTYFKKATKKSVFAFIKEVKIGYACKLLTSNKGKTISEICFDSGYNNIANFNRQFKEITNMSPKEYRQSFN